MLSRQISVFMVIVGFISSLSYGLVKIEEPNLDLVVVFFLENAKIWKSAKHLENISSVRCQKVSLAPFEFFFRDRL